MLFSQSERNLMYINRIVDRLINTKKDIFKDNIENLDISESIYKYKDFSYTYGHSEEYGYYFIGIAENKEGFMWIKPPLFEENENGLFYATKNYKYLEKNFYNVFNMENFRNIYVNYIRTNKLEQNIESFLAVVIFRSFPWFKRFNRKLTSKIIGVYIFNLIYQFKNEVNVLNKEIRELNLMTPDEPHDMDNIIKAATFTGINLDKILKKEISFIDIVDNFY